MQDYYFAPEEMLVIEIGKDAWAFNPRENKQLNNVFHFLTWEEDGSVSPDNNEFDTMEDFYKSLRYAAPFSIKNLENALRAKNYVFYSVCKDEESDLYELKDYGVIIGFIFQRIPVLMEKGFKHKMCEPKVIQEIQYYNQYLSGDVFFVNAYNEDEAVSHKNGIYERDKELDNYEDCYYLGSYSSFQECLEENPDLFKKTDNSGLRNKVKKNNKFVFR